MSITTEAELETAITNWLGGRTDLTARYPEWITLFEAHAARKLRVRPMETSATLTPSSGSATLPSDYLGWRRVTWQGSTNVELAYVHPQWMKQQFPSSTADPPAFFTIEGTTLKIPSSSTTTIQLDYYAKNTAIASTLNWLFNNYPDAYLWGALVEAHAFTADQDQLTVAKLRRDEIMDEISKLNFRESGAGMAMRPMGVVW